MAALLLKFSNSPSQSFWVALVVASVHLLLACGLSLRPTARFSQPAPTGVEVFFVSTPNVQTKRWALDVPLKIKTRISVQLPHFEVAQEVLSPPQSMAITIPVADKARPVHPAAPITPDLTEWDAGLLSQSCARSFSAVAGYLTGESSLMLQIFVEEDGRVSRATVAQSSGDELRDATIRACVLTHGEFQPTLVEGRPVASWQRLHWAHRKATAIAMQ